MILFRRGFVVLCLMVAFGLAACSAGSDERSVPSSNPEVSGSGTVPDFVLDTDPSAVSGCVEAGDITLVLDSPGVPAEALTFGEGDRAVILGHQAEQGPCAWAAFGRELAAQGWRVFIPELNHEPLPLLQASVDWLTGNGVTSFALVGASMGGAFALSAAPDLAPEPSEVVAISSPASYGPADALGNIGRIGVPVTLIAAEDDDDFAEQAQLMNDQNADAELVIVPGSAHGTDLLDANTDVRGAVLASLEAVR
ncbi:dienelactone hydrolase family protein [Herbiconiux moechotypicola]|uniref:Dienelactone hydrolase domain-containing protein n=1 Tax=Herbiconiux moechotypicola TaxID=637393 RepID=A0ABN3DFD1_9MICO|nr:dienelactone hydrolase family protein [Herbiconiux moechotypicola]MCS5729410.1 dienelactone hydrolase family protein [Herbiconiux moechotypicola]